MKSRHVVLILTTSVDNDIACIDNDDDGGNNVGLHVLMEMMLESNITTVVMENTLA